MAAHRLLLVRHAQTEQGSPDELRPLTDRGRRDAAAIGKWLTSAGVVPDAVVVSPAVRARETWDLAAGALSGGVPVIVDERIYDNRPDSLLAIARGSAESVATVAIVGHNPSIEWFLARQGGAGDVPTATVVVFDVDGAWVDGEITFAQAQVCRG